MCRKRKKRSRNKRNIILTFSFCTRKEADSFFSQHRHVSFTRRTCAVALITLMTRTNVDSYASFHARKKKVLSDFEILHGHSMNLTSCFRFSCHLFVEHCFISLSIRMRRFTVQTMVKYNHWSDGVRSSLLCCSVL